MRIFILPFVFLAGTAAAECPDPQLTSVSYAATGPDLLAPQSWELPAAGDHEAPCAAWSDSGVFTGDLAGYLPVAPTAVFELSGMAPHILMVMAEAACDPVLVVRTADGVWHFGETANGRYEVVVWSAPDGPLQVWLGSKEQGSCEGSVVLETFDR